ncbi:MAG: hypothetical protein ACJ79L_00225 [Anaeromyxobacteraceae bacterium]
MTRRRPAAPLAAALLVLLGACRGDGPEPTAVEPDHGPGGAPVRVVVRGRRFDPAVATDFTHPEDGRLDGRFALHLGDTALREVLLRPDGALEAIVPAGLAPGAHDLSVVRPDGQKGSLGAAYRVISSAPGDDAVAGFRLEVPDEVVAGTPFEVTLVALDAQGAPALGFGGAAEVSDRTGSAVPLRAGLFAGGRWTGAVEVRTAREEDVLVARVGDASGTSARFTVRPVPALSIAFATARPVVTAGSCAGPVVLALLDRFGEPTAALATAPVGLDLPAGMAAFADDACAAPFAPAIAPFQPAHTFFLRQTAVGPFTLGATVDGLGTATLDGEVVPAGPARLVLEAPSGAVAGGCTVASVLVQDAFGNSVPALDLPIAIGATPPGGFELRDPGCAARLDAARPGADGRATFAFLETVAWPVTLTASAEGVAPVSRVIAVAPDAASRLAFVSPPPAATAGRCSPPLTVAAVDRFGNAAALEDAVALALAIAPAGAALFADAACSRPVASAAIEAGRASIDLYLRAPAAGAYRVNVTAPGLDAGAQDVEVAP